MPTIALGIANLALYAIAISLTTLGVLPLWLGIAIAAVTVYVGYTPLHEAVHGNISRGSTRGSLNVVVGMLGAIPAMHNVHLHRITHLSHHAHLNDPDRDADHWVATPSFWMVPAKCLTLIGRHFVVGLRMARRWTTGRRRLLYASIEQLISLVPFLLVGLFASWGTAIVIVALPALLGAAALGFFFDYLVHAPHDTSDAVAGTRAFVAPGGWNRLLTALYIGQNYHLIHHVTPKLAFYEYRVAFEHAEEALRHRGAPVVSLGRLRRSILD